jgi:Zn finger protein HypA/HybF involved in hydrogenase expression
MRKRTEGLVESFTWVAINWQSAVLTGIWLVVGILAFLAFDSSALRDRLPLILLTLVACVAVVCLVLSRFCTPRCASCGSSPAELAWEPGDCPRCHQSYCETVDLLAGAPVLSLPDGLADQSIPLVKLFSMILTLALRDCANQVRLVGRKVNDPAEYPWATTCWSWTIWISVKGTDYEMVPPPRHLGAGLFDMLRETYRKVEKETPNGPARLPITLDDWSEVLQLVIEESDKEQVATILFSSESREPVSGADTHLRELYSRSDAEHTTNPLPPATTWKRFPRFVPMVPKWALIAINSIAAFLAVVSFLVMAFMANMSAHSPSFVVMIMSCIVLLAGASLLAVRRECRCGALLAYWSDDELPIWCPECQSVFDPTGRGLPMDGSTLRLVDLRKCKDPHAYWLVPLLEHALNCQKQQIVLRRAEQTVSAQLSKAGTDTVELEKIDSWRALGLMAEFEGRVQAQNGDGTGTFKIVGSFREAVVTLDVNESKDQHVVTLNFDYGAEDWS